MTRLTRRAVLGGLAAGVAGQALGAPLSSPRPVPRAQIVPAEALRVASSQDLIAAAKLGGNVGFVVADAKTGRILESVSADTPMPPASVTKAITSLYALEHLGGDYRFGTRLIATGPIRGGVISGDLVLAGGGDPTLSTDTLGDMAAALRRAGVTGVSGRFLVWGGALPYTHEIDPAQPDHVGYNPAVSGLNLNFNRVHFEWKRVKGGYDVGMDARGERFLPRAYTAKIAVKERALPIYTYSDKGRVEEWTVASRALNKAGSRWLPVRRPELYAADVFQTLARAQGVPLGNPEIVRDLPGGTVIVEHNSDSLRPLLTEMMRYSTNITAEAVGMTASARRGGLASHAGSGRLMTEWLKDRAGARSARFVDHSGLGGDSRISAGEMVGALVRLGPAAGLRGLMKDFTMRDEADRVIRNHPLRVEAKTGTLNFVSALAGWMTAPSGADMVFAIFSGDVARRDRIPNAERERPQGGREWIRRSRRLQQQLIERWGAVHG
ncbi:D-alanyl-D-alanine carboxypeptidase/D-alanyl-D-alanine endopeptidase [Ostreiculturibacter nitratireducens]|uniref:D-alanyl-D-alanine carboxypeptidase/D-alanyl-D-alanine endopeptidase n=1 Tax=Ostreiculturibacter nitratireducens TaxID=3075226 RepID=UPI0031B568FA